MVGTTPTLRPAIRAASSSVRNAAMVAGVIIAGSLREHAHGADPGRRRVASPPASRAAAALIAR